MRHLLVCAGLLTVALFSEINTSVGQDNKQTNLDKLTGRIVFTSNRDSKGKETMGNIYIMDANGSNVKRLTNHDKATDWYPKWSPDGKKIAFLSDRDRDPSFDIYIMDADGSNVKRLTDRGQILIDMLTRRFPFSWSPDSKKIVFVDKRDGNDEIYTVDVERNMKNLTNNKADDYNPAWSPTGKHIAFFRDTDHYVIEADGSNVRKVEGSNTIDGEKVYYWYPGWSPDKKYFLSELYENGNYEICIIKDGKEKKILTNNKGSCEFPVWSPGGKKIAFVSDSNNTPGDIYVMEIDGSNSTNITNSKDKEVYNIQPSWSD